ncbi:hypothetical protein ACI65C_007746 [Semiaphis heraclei]
MPVLDHLAHSLTCIWRSHRLSVVSAAAEEPLATVTTILDGQTMAASVHITARNSCCSLCFIGWMNEYDPDNDYEYEEIIRCRKCFNVINNALSSDELNSFCKLVELDEKRKTSRTGHYGYPVLGNSAMDQLYEDIESDSDSSD